MILVIANMGIERIAPAPSAQHPLRSEVVPFDVTGPPPLAARRMRLIHFMIAVADQASINSVHTCH